MLLRAVFLAFLLHTAIAGAWEIAGGLVSMEEGDDRQRPGIAFSVDHADVLARAVYLARTFGPVRESTVLLGISREFPLPFFSSSYVHVGLGTLREQTTITYHRPEDQAFNMDETRYNFGLMTGLQWKPKIAKNLIATLAWESGIFPAGLGGIFLSTGRKQCVSLSLGVKL